MANDASATEIEAFEMSGKGEDKGSEIVPEVSPDTNISEAIPENAEAEKTVEKTEEVKIDEPVVEVPAKIEPKPEPKVEAKPDQPTTDYKAEMVKRYGERPIEELTQEAWKSYRGLEKEFDRRNTLYKETIEVAEKFGGIDALKQILATPKEALLSKPAPEAKTDDGLPVDIQQLIDEGELDLQSPKDQMFIRQELRIREQDRLQETEAERRYTAQQQEAVQQFETFLKDEITPKYEYADVNAIKAKAYAGAWRGLSDEAFKLAVEDEAKALHEKVETLANSRTENKLAEFRKIKDKSVVVGKTIATPAKKMSFREAFEAAYDDNFKN